MSAKKLQIKHLSNNGELLKVVNCQAGRVTVLRAVAIKDLAPFQRALAGTPGPERFVLSLDGNDFIQEQHSLIGFGEQFLNPELSVTEFLADEGIESLQATGTLHAYGLENISKLKVSELSDCQIRRLRIIIGTYHPTRVLVLNNPFDPISSQWREKFASLICSFAQSQSAIVIVPSLSYRPESWINNDLINRVQVGETLQRTIGFGSAPNEINTLVEQVRSMVKSGAIDLNDPAQKIPSLQEQQAAVKPEPEPEPLKAEKELPKKPEPADTSSSASARLMEWEDKTEASQTSRPARHAPSPQQSGLRVHPLLYILMFCVIGLQLYLLSERSNPIPTPVAKVAPETTEIKKVAVNKPESIKPIASKAPALKSKPAPAVPEKTQPAPQKPRVTRVALVLDTYPSDIKASILKGFEGGGTSQPSTRGDTQPSRPQPATEKSSLFSLLEKASGTGKNVKQGSSRSNEPLRTFNQPPTGGRIPSPVSTSSSEEINKRREMIRKKFLEAVERASQRRQQ